MNDLPNELILLIFDNIKLITDKRQFLRTCNLYNNLTRQSFLQFEKEHKIGNKYGFLFFQMYNYCVEKFTLELCSDKYFSMIPISYINSKNTILVEALATFNCKPLLEMAKYSGCKMDQVCYIAITTDNLNIFSWGKKYDYFCKASSYAFTHAATYGYIEVLEWGHSYGCNFNDDIWPMAALLGQLDVLKWAKKHNYYLNMYICSSAAKNGHLNVLKWARQNGCDWNYDTLANARKNGHIECLNWAIENGCQE